MVNLFPTDFSHHKKGESGKKIILVATPTVMDIYAGAQYTAVCATGPGGRSFSKKI